MLSYGNLFFAILGITVGLPPVYPVLSILAAALSFAMARADAVDHAKHVARMAEFRSQH